MRLVEHARVLGPAPCASCGKRGSWLCASCAADARPAPVQPAPPGIETVIAPWAYEGGPRSLVLALKLRHMRAAAAPLIHGMVLGARRHGIDADAVTWVPARVRDVSARGFDHAEVLGRGVAAELGLPAHALLRRKGSQRDQTGLDRPERLANLQGAFVARGRVGPRVVLVDDLVTTGATAIACAAALRSAGAASLVLLAACRA